MALRRRSFEEGDGTAFYPYRRQSPDKDSGSESVDSDWEGDSDCKIRKVGQYVKKRFQPIKPIILMRGEQITSYAIGQAKQNDVIIMARYVEDDSSRLQIAYCTIGEITLTRIYAEKFFKLKILNDCDPRSKFIFEAKGVCLFPCSSDFSSTENSKIIQLEKPYISFSIEHSASKPVVVNGTFVFYEINQKESKNHGCVEVRSCLFPFEVTRSTSIVDREVQCGAVSAFIWENKELVGFLGFENVYNLSFCNLEIHMENIFVEKETIASFQPSNVKIENLIVTTAELSRSNVSAIRALLLKLPFCNTIVFKKDKFSSLVSPLQHYSPSECSLLRAFTSTYGEGEQFADLLIDFLKFPPNPFYLKVLKLVGVNLQPKSLDKVQHLINLILSFVRTKEEVVFTNLESSFHLLISLTSTDNKLTEFLEQLDATSLLLSVCQFSLTFRDGKLNRLRIPEGQAIRFNSYAEVIAVCRMWRVQQVDDIKFDNFSLIYQERDYSFLFQLTNSFSFDHLEILNKIQVFKFDRECLIDTTGILSKFQLAGDLANFSLNSIVLETFQSDSRNEMDGLIAAFCKELDRMGIRVKTLKLEVHCDETGWAFTRFTLTQRKTIVSLKDLEIIFPSNSTKEPLLVAIEINRFPNHIIDYVNQRRTNGYCEITPLVNIDYSGVKPFLQQIAVVFPFPEGCERFTPKLFTKHPPAKLQWERVFDYEIVLDGGVQYLIYSSDTFSPVVGEFHTGEASSSPESYIQRYFKETTFVTILVLEYRIGNVVFDCVKEKDETHGKNLRLNPFFEKRKIEMQVDQKLLAKLGKNLTVLEPELEKENELEFFSPDHKDHVSNQQEYTMGRVDANGAWRGYIDYKIDGQDRKIFHMFYHLPYLAFKTDHDDSDEKEHAHQPNHDKRKVALEKALYKLEVEMTNSAQICSYLVSKGQMTMAQAIEIRSLKSNQDRNWELVKHVLARGPSAYDKFRDGMMHAGEPASLIEILPLFEDRYQDTVDDLESVSSTEAGEQVDDLQIDAELIEPGLNDMNLNQA